MMALVWAPFYFLKVFVMNLSKEELSLCQRALNELTSSRLKADGVIGPASKQVVSRFQQMSNIQPADGEINEPTYAVLKSHIDARFVRRAEIAQMARDVAIMPSMLLAIVDKESTGAGFLPDGRAVILFERHKFYQFTKAKYNEKQAEAWRAENSNVCFPVWTHDAYFGGAGEWDRFEAARSMEAEIAMLSTSWGLMQVMGFNYHVCGYDNVQDMVQDMTLNETLQMRAAINFICKQPNLYTAAKNRNFEGVARVYNGAGFKKNNYDVILAQLEAKNRNFN